MHSGPAALELFGVGPEPARVPPRVNARLKSVSRWAKNAEIGGANALRSADQLGRRPRLTSDQKKELAAMLAEGADAFGYQSAKWNGDLVAGLIEEKFGISYHSGHAWKILQSLTRGRK